MSLTTTYRFIRELGLDPRRIRLLVDAGTLHEDIPVTDIATACASVLHGCGNYTFATARTS
jgi:hypothetical protein